MTIDLALIVIARNEEGRISDCLDSCVRAISRARAEGLLRTARIVLADSASTDQTIRRARKFPVTIVRLGSGWPLSAAAGRFVGLRHADSEFVLFVDGDYVLYDDWLPVALRIIRGDADIAAVCGRHNEEVTGEGFLMQAVKESTESAIGDPEAVPIGLYRADLVRAVGGIHPFLRGGEDRDLAHRLRAAGHRIVRTDAAMGVHRWSDGGPLDYVTYFRSILAWSIGDGQAFRLRKDRSFRRQALKRYGNARHLVHDFYGLLLIVPVLTVLLAGWSPAVPAVLSIVTGYGLGLEVIRRRWRLTWRAFGFRLHAVPYSLIRQAGFVIGFLRSTPHPSSYPAGEEILQQVDVPFDLAGAGTTEK